MNCKPPTTAALCWLKKKRFTNAARKSKQCSINALVCCQHFLTHRRRRTAKRQCRPPPPPRSCRPFLYAPKLLTNCRGFLSCFHWLHSTEDVQTFVYYAVFIHSIYQKLSRPTKANYSVEFVQCTELWKSVCYAFQLEFY